MKTLLILRHAKSSWKQHTPTDHDRPLNNRGKRDALRMAKLVEEQAFCPALILASPAKRARLTAEAVAVRLTGSDVIRLEPRLYLASMDAIVSVLQEASDRVNCLMVVGHNPGLEELARVLTGGAEPLVTGALVNVQLPIEKWDALGVTDSGHLVGRWIPRALED